MNLEFLPSNYRPLITSMPSFYDTFYKQLCHATQVNIAVGYITLDSLLELRSILELNKRIQKLNLIIGMHYFDKFTEAEHKAAKILNSFLIENNYGEVRLVNTFRFHGKIYAFMNDNEPFSCIIGSNNLSSIVKNCIHIYETAVLIDDKCFSREVSNFMLKLEKSSTENISEINITDFRKIDPPLQNHEYVESVNQQDIDPILSLCSDTIFDIPIGIHDKSGINAYFGKGRKGKNGIVKPRSWYEVELIVPKYITSKSKYPKSETGTADFNVITDDGYKFKCKVSGDYNKNFRSKNDLSILGRWLKGRLEIAGLLSPGEKVTDETLARYGRNTIALAQIENQNLWYLDFKKPEDK